MLPSLLTVGPRLLVKVSFCHSILTQLFLWPRAQDNMPGPLEHVQNALQATNKIKIFHALENEEAARRRGCQNGMCASKRRLKGSRAISIHKPGILCVSSLWPQSSAFPGLRGRHPRLGLKIVSSPEWQQPPRRFPGAVWLDPRGLKQFSLFQGKERQNDVLIEGGGGGAGTKIYSF